MQDKNYVIQSKKKRGDLVAKTKEETSSIIEVTEVELADMLGVSQRRVRQLAVDGVAVKTRAGRYDLKLSVQNYIRNIKDKDKTANQGIDKIKAAREAEGLMTDRLKKKKIELQVRKMENQLHEAEDVKMIWNTMIVAAKSRITSIPTKTAPKLVGLENIKEVESILSREVKEALNEIAEYDVNKFVEAEEMNEYGTEADDD